MLCRFPIKKIFFKYFFFFYFSLWIYEEFKTDFMMQFSWFWLKFLCTTLTDKSELFKSPCEYFFLFVLMLSIKIRGQILLRGHTSLMFHCCFNCDSIHLSEAFGLPELKMCWYLSTMILSRIASILQKHFNLKFYDTFPVFLYCFDSYPGRKVELQDCKILAFFNNSSEVLEEKE